MPFAASTLGFGLCRKRRYLSGNGVVVARNVSRTVASCGADRFRDVAGPPSVSGLVQHVDVLGLYVWNTNISNKRSGDHRPGTSSRVDGTETSSTSTEMVS